MIQTLTALLWKVPRAFVKVMAALEETRAQVAELNVALAERTNELLESEARCETLVDTLHLERDTILAMLITRGDRKLLVPADHVRGKYRHSFVIHRNFLATGYVSVEAIPLITETEERPS